MWSAHPCVLRGDSFRRGVRSKRLIASFAWITVTALAQPPASNGPVFKTDTLDPEQGGAVELLEAVCPGRVVAGDEISCRGECREFPGDGVRESVGGWRITGVLRGHFLARDSDDAVLSETGCLPHSMIFGGSFLLSRQSGTWKLVWFKPGLITDRCHMVEAADGRDLLLCYGEWGGQGLVESWITLEDLKLPPRLPWDRHILTTIDSRAACGGIDVELDMPKAIVYSYMEHVDFTTRGFVVRARYGTMMPTKRQLANCLEGRPFGNVATKPYRIEFLFDGKTYRVAPSSRAAAKVFQK